MRKHVLFFVLYLVMALPAMSQEEDVVEPETEITADNEAESAGADAVVEDADETEVDDSDLDIQTYEGPEDVFIPTEEIPSDQPIPFPSNI